MGKRKKAARGPIKKAKQELQKNDFTCLFCNQEESVKIKLDRKAGLGMLHCQVCGQRFQTSVTELQKPIDVYADWIDATEIAEGEGGDEPLTPVDSNFSSKSKTIAPTATNDAIIASAKRAGKIRQYHIDEGEDSYAERDGEDDGFVVADDPEPQDGGKTRHNEYDDENEADDDYE